MLINYSYVGKFYYMIKGNKNKETNEFYYKKDRLAQLKGFCSIVQNDCCARKASKVLNLEESTIGKQVRSLESQLDIKLFDRSRPNKLVLTDDGKLFYEKAVLKIQSIENLFSEFLSEKEYRNNNILRIATFDTVIEKMLPCFIEFKSIYPDVELMLYNISKEDAFKKLINNELDLVIYATDITDECPIEIKREELSENISFLTMHKDHPLAKMKQKDITREEIAKYPFGLFSGVVYSKSFESFIKENNLKPPINIKHGTMNLIKEMIKNNMCIALLDDFYLNAHDKKNLVLKNDLPGFPPMFFYSFSRKNGIYKKIAKEFLELIKKNKDTIFH